MIRVVIADDHELIREGFKRLIEGQPGMECSAETGLGTELIPLLLQNPIDVLILDLNLPDRSGLEVLKDVRAQNLSVGILVLSFYPEEQFAKRCLKAGAAGYLSKDKAGAELITAIRRIAAGGRYLSQETAQALALAGLSGVGEATHHLLSDREFELMLLFGRGLNLRQAADNLNISINTVSSYKSRLWKKMGFTSNADLVRYVVAQGLI